MKERVKQFIEQNHLLQKGGRVVAGVSGGADSTALLCLLCELRDELDLQVEAVHIHHGIRGEEADRDREFTEELARRRGVLCTTVYVRAREYAAEKGISEEEAGRILRYGALRQEAERMGGARIAVGHHREDQAETILHNLFRGSGLKGLSGMAAEENGVIRPLLCVGREEILGYLAGIGQPYCADSTNETDDYTRNRIRKLLQTACSQVNPGAARHIAEAGSRMAEADAYFESRAAGILETECRRQAGGLGIKADVLSELPDILAEYVVMGMIRMQAGRAKDIASAHVEAVLGLAKKGSGKRVRLPYGMEAVREYETIRLQRAEEREDTRQDAAPGFRPDSLPRGERLGIQTASGEGEQMMTLEFSRFAYEKNQKIPENRYTKWFDYDKIKGTLLVRHRESGDYISLKGGGRKSLKSYLIDQKIPLRLRDGIPVLAEGKHILWIVGWRISEYYKVTDDTKEILQVQAHGGEKDDGGSSGSDPGRGSGAQDR